jgi:hypothetical protein
VTAGDWVRVLNLLGSLILSIGSWRGQRWSKRQAKIQDDAAASRVKPVPVPGARDPQQTRPAMAAPGELEKAAAEIASQPYFDRWAYRLFLLGFLIATLASAIDLYSHDTLAHLIGKKSLPAVQTAE